MQKTIATLYRTDGTITEVSPKDGKTFTLKELQHYVDGYFRPLYGGNGMVAVVNEDGIPLGLPINPNSNKICRQVKSMYFITFYGDVLVTTKESI